MTVFCRAHKQELLEVLDSVKGHSGGLLGSVTFNSCEWLDQAQFYPPMSFTAGLGCTILEIFDRDAPEPSVPIQRVLL